MQSIDLIIYSGNNWLTVLDYLFFNCIMEKYDEKIYSKG